MYKNNRTLKESSESLDFNICEFTKKNSDVVVVIESTKFGFSPVAPLTAPLKGYSSACQEPLIV